MPSPRRRSHRPRDFAHGTRCGRCGHCVEVTSNAELERGTSELIQKTHCLSFPSESNGLQPFLCLQPNSNGLQPTLLAMASNPIAMASNLLAMASDLIQAMASNLIAIMASTFRIHNSNRKFRIRMGVPLQTPTPKRIPGILMYQAFLSCFWSN